ncbi:MAG: hypothetical protein A2Z20_11895 [Bdellovibrionales bacterium RBG_16_40_8]|nr:MAG: hypothetical protein A2Z20_11895 [Bdellovibrionales bacterium RBG_16_40_8]
MTLRSLYNLRGFTLLEVLMVVLLTGVLATVSVLTITSGIDDARFSSTVAEMNSLRDALIGNTDLQEGGIRSNFGYLGDIGALPTNAQGLNALLANPGVPAWNVNTTSRFALGWNGPYITGGGVSSDYTKDSWDRNYIFDFTTNPATITSRGADGAVGGTQFNQDIVVQIPLSLQRATVHGFISNSGSPYTGTADVDLYYPVAGVLTTVTTAVAIAANGYFNFANVPFGRRSAKIYTPSKAAPTQTLGPALFVVDKNNFVIPTEYTDTGAGGGGGGGCSAGSITFVAGTADFGVLTTTRIEFTLNVVPATVVISGIQFNLTTLNRVVDRFRLNGVNHTCAGGFTSGCSGAPSSIPEDTPAVLNPAQNVNSGNRTGYIRTPTGTFVGETRLTLTITHDFGCDTLIIE